MKNISKIMAFTTAITMMTIGGAYAQDAMAPDAGHTVAEGSSSSYSNDNTAPSESLSYEDSVAPSSGGLTQNQTRQIQSKLKEAGYRVSIDGIFGPKTTAAIRSFQNDNDLSDTGQPDSQTLAALGVELR
jgi:peptidoglycan hydrolase-like protein with peptidoglycan-binding domain